MLDLGRIAYEAYGQDADWLTFNGRRMPPWFDLGPDVQRHWQRAATAVLRAADPCAEVALGEVSDNSDEPEEPPKKHSRSQRPTGRE